MITRQLNLTDKQVSSFDLFLADGTDKALTVLDNLFGLDIDSSDSCIEIALAVHSENLKHLGNETLYSVSSTMVGGLQGQILVLMRSSDFAHLSNAMRPMLSLLFLTGTNADLTLQESPEQDWMDGDGSENPEEAEFHKQMMDTLSEMSNVFIGLYAKAIYNICGVNTHYSVPQALKDPDQLAIRQIFAAPDATDQLHLVIQNEFFVLDKPINLWCIISPTQKSFGHILRKIECNEEVPLEPFKRVAAA